MIRFVAIASIRRGAIEPAEPLDDANQNAAFARYEADEYGLGEIVVWQAGQPSVASAVRKPAGSVRWPRVSSDLKAALRGAPMCLDDQSALDRRRAGIRSRV